MKILALNCGSSTLKFQLVQISDGSEGADHCLVRGLLKIGSDGELALRTHEGETLQRELAIPNHAAATHVLLQWLAGHKDHGPGTIEAVGLRVVHGGEQFTKPTVLGERELAELGRIGQLAPLHNVRALEVMREMRRILGFALPMVATFDTAFHQRLPEHARRYAIPEELTIKHRVWRYGFHGLAHRWMMEQAAVLAKRPWQALKLVTLQLGSGCSAAAIDCGRSIETSMGLTPLEGLMMATRSGDLDPALARWLAQQEGVSVEQIIEWLNTRSGLLGVHGSARDLRVILAAEQAGDRRARLAVEMFCHRIRKYVGAYLAVLGGADALVFGGGIGENAPVIRERICAHMDWCGLRLDRQRNAAVAGQEARISTDDSPISVYVIPVNEEAIIARDTFDCLAQRGP